MDKELTECQRGILAAIEQWTAKHHCPPSLRELAGAVGWSSHGSMSNELRRMRAGGRVTWKARQARTLKVVTVGVACLQQHGIVERDPAR